MDPPASIEPGSPLESDLLEQVIGRLESDRRWLKLTFDQLRTLLVVYEQGSTAAAAKRLGRQQSSVQKQMTTLDGYFKLACGEPLTEDSRRRGRPLVFTPTGEQAVAWAGETLRLWQHGISDRRRALAETITISTTAFAIDVLGEFWPRIAEYARVKEIQINVQSVGTRDFLRALDDRSVDLVLGGRAKPQGESLIDEDLYKYIPLERHRIWLLTTQPEMGKPGVRLTRRKLDEMDIKFVLPRGPGLIPDILTQWLGEDYMSKITVVAHIADIHFGLSLLHYDIVDGASMVVLGTIKDRIEAGVLRRPKGSSFVPVDEDLASAVESIGGMFARKQVLESRPDDHPINHIWREFRAFAAEQRDAAAGST